MSEKDTLDESADETPKNRQSLSTFQCRPEPSCGGFRMSNVGTAFLYAEHLKRYLDGSDKLTQPLILTKTMVSESQTLTSDEDDDSESSKDSGTSQKSRFNTTRLVFYYNICNVCMLKYLPSEC